MQKLEANVREAVKELGLKATIEKVEDFKDIMAYGVMRTPALVVDEQVKIMGRVPSVEDIKKIFIKKEAFIMGCCETQRNNTCCSTSCGCEEQNYEAEKKKIIIDFMYLDLSICTRCQGTEDSIEEAIEDVAKVLELAGAEVVVNKIHIDSKERPYSIDLRVHLLSVLMGRIYNWK